MLAQISGFVKDRNGKMISPHFLSVYDDIAMNLDDTAKLAANAKAIMGMLETKGNLNAQEYMKYFTKISKQFGTIGALEHEDVGKRLAKYPILCIADLARGDSCYVTNCQEKAPPFSPL